jgi:Tol biopolymer transport system component/DNA-binding winged helix-turn-helix (wHTH) protein
VHELRHSSGIFRFGAFEADLASGELRKHGLRIRLQEQPFQVLALLLDRAGEVVGRGELCRSLWPADTYVDFEQGLGTAIKKLRVALNDDANAPRYIETLPKRGYRLIVPVELLASSPEPVLQLDSDPEVIAELPLESVPAELPTVEYWRASSSSYRPFLLGALFMLAAVFCGIGFETWRSSHAKQPAGVANGTAAVQPYTARPLTTLSGGEYEPALSPDGKMLAFVWDEHGKQRFRVYTQTISTGEPKRLTTDDANEGSPVWSPDGRYVAFITYSESVEESGIYVAPVAGGARRKIASIAPRGTIYVRQIDWSPDGSTLAVADRQKSEDPYAIYLLSLNSGARRRLVEPVPASPGDNGPVFSPDGRQIAFRRTESIGNNDMYVVGIAGGKPRRVTFDQRFASSVTWTRDGNEIVFASKRAGPLSLWRVKVSGAPPQAIAGNTEGGYYLGSARNTDEFVYSRYLSDSNLWEMDVTTGSNHCVLHSTRNETSPQYSPDGTRIVFRSDRTGNDEIWVSDRSGDHAVPLTSFNGPLTGTPRWSPDGQFVVFDSRPNGNPDIYVVSASGGPPRRVTSAPAEDVLPSWSGDGRWLYFASNRSRRWQVWKIASDAVNESAAPTQLTHQGGFSAFESPDGKSVFYAKGRDVAGIWSVPSGGGNERLVTGLLGPGYWGNWGVARNGLFFVSPVPPDRAAVDLYRIPSGRLQRIALFEIPPPFSDSGFAVRQDGSAILHTQMDQISSEIMLVENFR